MYSAISNSGVGLASNETSMIEAAKGGLEGIGLASGRKMPNK